MNKSFNYIGLNFDNLALEEVVQRVKEYIENRKSASIFTPNSELIVRANRNKKLREIYNNSDILTIDSWVVYYSAKLLKKPIKEPVSAAKLMFRLLEVSCKKGWKLYCLGAKDYVIKKAVYNIRKQYPGINIVGYHHGYFDFNKDSEIVRDINNKKPDILFVAMSSPLKEFFIAKNKVKLGVPVCIGVGGTIDIIADINKLAPLWVSRIGMEWFYRFIQEPRRLLKRYLSTNIIYIFLFLKEIFKGERNKVVSIE